MFEDNQEKEWIDPESPNSPKKKGKIGLGTVEEEDPNVFQGEPNEGDISP